MRKQAIDVFNQYGEIYDAEFVSAIDRFENDWTFRQMARQLCRHLPDDGTVLDAGCGTGLVLEELDLTPDRYIGVDFSETMLTVARKKFPYHRFVEQDLRHFGCHPVDAVVSTFASLSYIIVGQHLMPETIASWLKPNGTIFLQYFGHRYRHARKNFTALPPFFAPTAKELYRMYSPNFTDIQIRGLSSFVDRIPLKAWFELDAAVIGRLVPDAGMFIQITGRKKVEKYR